MSRLLHFKAVTAFAVAATIIGSLFLQMILPTIAFAIETSDDTDTSINEDTNASSTESNLVEPDPDKKETADSSSTEATSTSSSEELPGSPPTGTSTIQTGDATAGLSATTEVNKTTVDTSTSTASSTDDSSGTTTTQSIPSSELLPDPVATNTIQTGNTATTSTHATSAATTGSNDAYDGTAEITTGDAIAYADVLNVVNTNIVNSEGLVTFINETLGYEDFNLQQDFELTFASFDTAETTTSCLAGSCDNTQQLYASTNTAAIDNDVTVVADTGDNTATGSTTSVTTGNAYASANVINVANTNIVDSQYLLLVFNNFNDYSGDIVLPNSTFFDQYLSGGGGTGHTDTSLNNQADITNDTTAIADSGHNTAAGDSATVTTGNAVAVSDTTNQVNQNIIGGNSFNMLIRVHGDWSGTVSGLPEGLTWRETERGIEIISADQSSPLSSDSDSITTNNQATINNNVRVFALTGDNQANGSDTTITTGNAYAGASIMNIANTNVIGSNWANLIFTIYGNWNGNLAFGQPDLWLGVTANSPNQPIMPGSPVTYTFTVFNAGDTVASDVTLESMFENDALTFAQSDDQERTDNSTRDRWSLGDIDAGETREFTHTATVNELLAADVVSAIPLVSQVTSSQRDANDTDNEEVVTIYVGERRSSSDGRSDTFPANVEITKTASRDLAQPGDMVDYTITLFNNGGQLYDSLLVDTLENAAGEIVQEQTWPLGEIKNWETITIKYSMVYDSDMATSTYTNYAQLVGFHESRKARYQTPYQSPVATHSLDLGTLPTGRVLGAFDSVCEPYLTEYLRFGADNDPNQVRKLQIFLNEQLDRALTVSGIFDQETEQAVRDFQIIHKGEILLPWGLERDSGFVYYTTQKKINETVCAGESFPLSPDQQTEMQRFKEQVQSSQHFGFIPTDQPDPSGVPAVATTGPSPSSPQRETPPEEPADPPEPPIPLDPPLHENAWGGLKTWWRSFELGELLSIRR